MTPRQHAISSIPVGLVCHFLFGNAYASVLSMAAATFIDADHFLDQIWERKGWLSPAEAMKIESESAKKKVILLFHSWEPLLALSVAAFLSNNIWLLAVSLGAGVHLLCDNVYWVFIDRRIKPFMYFFLYRLYYNFDARSFIANPPH